MAMGLGAPGQSPELHAGEVRFKSLEQYREQMRLITRQGLVDIMLMSASSNYALTFGERLFDDSAVTPAIRANDTTDIFLARGSVYAAEPSRPFRTASIDHAQCGHLDCAADERGLGANLGLYSVTFNNDMARDVETLERFHAFREEAERKGFRYFLEVFDPNVATGLDPAIVPFYLNDMITRMLAGVAPAGRPDFLKIVYHGPKAMEELVRFDRNLIVGILGGSAGTTRDAFQLLADAQKYGAKVALFGRKINNAENQLAFVQILRLIVEGQIGPVDAVKAYHAVLGRLGVPPQRKLEDDLKITTQAMSYAGGGMVTVPAQAAAIAAAASSPSPSSNGRHACACHEKPEAASPAPAHANGDGNGFPAAHFLPKPLVTESKSTSASESTAFQVDGRPDFARMTPSDRLAYHRQRLGLGR